MFEKTDKTNWCAVPLLDSDSKPTLWFESDLEAYNTVDGEGYSIQYRPRRRKVKVIKTSDAE